MPTPTDPTPTPLLRHVILLLLLLLSLLLFLCLSRHRLFSPIALKDLHLSLTFLLANLTPTSLTSPSCNSTSLNFWIPQKSNSKSKSNPKPPLLLIHGFGGNAKWQFASQIRPLSSTFDLYIPDLLFFGRSTTTAADRSVEFQAKCLVEAMRVLGVERYSVTGISYGGYVAYRVAEMAGEEVVEKVVIMTAGVCAGEEERRELVEREGRDVFEVLLPRRVEDLRELMRRSMCRPPRWTPAFLLSDFIEVIVGIH